MQAIPSDIDSIKLTAAAAFMMKLFGKEADALLDRANKHVVREEPDATLVLNTPLLVSQIAISVALQLVHAGMIETGIFAGDKYSKLLDGLESDNERALEVDRVQRSIVHSFLVSTVQRITDESEELNNIGRKTAHAQKCRECMKLMIREHEVFMKAVELCPTLEE